MIRWFQNWKWTLLFVAVIFSSAGFLGTWTQTAYSLVGGAAVRSATAILLLLSAAVLLIFALRRTQGDRLQLLLGLALLVPGYLFAMTRMAPYPVEKVHLLEYGILGYLLYTGFQKTARGNSLWKAFSFLCLIGFADEIYQGILPQRRYDDQDILLNFVAGFLGLVVTLLLRREPLRVLTGRAFHRSNLPYLFLWLLGILTYGYIHATPVPSQEIVGSWKRMGDCHSYQWICLGSDGSFLWYDEDGNRAEGEYRLSSNRLEGVYLHILCNRAQMKNQCALDPGSRFSYRVSVTSRVLRFRQKDGGDPWVKEQDACPSSAREIVRPGAGNLSKGDTDSFGDNLDRESEETRSTSVFLTVRSLRPGRDPHRGTATHPPPVSCRSNWESILFARITV